ncbi:MAG: bifunctional phosphoribosylaminoimidazolecarboxamide formyltransferase/IMP cyclohydrolase [Cytophagaceae bacterium]|jgi:phosphoribosylaminoimidazolecarboxamide formyltransferase/IMP cyclohydrolase|nr:bifunctional phosphoribosylaminoimidazolecarboxamide formyltransferase/IMP cyclohydrolase [Cytophagaceae bacterium]
MESKKIKSALISVFYKDGLDSLVKLLDKNGVVIYSTGGTQQFIEDLGIKVQAVENLTGYPSIFGGRVKTLHPKVFGGILHRRHLQEDLNEAAHHEIPAIDLVIVDLYPFEQTVASGAPEEDIIEKVDIGGVSLIRAAAKNFKDVVIVSDKKQYPLLESIVARDCSTSLNQRRLFATQAFDTTSHYDTAIFNYFAGEEIRHFKQSIQEFQVLRYGENPHQSGVFYGNLDGMFDKLNGKELSYNNLVDVDAAIGIIDEFEGETTFAILKHTNACGVATSTSVKEAYLNALECDPVSAFGGVLVTNAEVDLDAARELHKLFFEVLIAPSFSEEALQLLCEKKNRILLRRKPVNLPTKLFKTLLNGVIEQDKDMKTERVEDLNPVTKRVPTEEEKKALVFASKIVKHTKSNTIVLAREGQLLSSGVGQTSRVDALKQAIEKAASFGFSLDGAVMASDAFFPFPDCVDIAFQAGIRAVVQPGGSIKDQDSIDFCDQNNMAMAFTGIRHFKH